MWNRALSEEQQAYTTGLHLRGGFDVALLRRVDRLMMALLRVSLRRGKNPTEDEADLPAWYDRAAVAPLVEHARGP